MHHELIESQSRSVLEEIEDWSINNSLSPHGKNSFKGGGSELIVRLYDCEDGS